ncbi:thymidylate synthase [Candidatus Saccharibacteria bacterium]|nr:thymidylate synthase [Candidatus Saccharibacteria bacterium]MCL1962829.1 thymidylate synthase [Candidatus Saccharibacteria bacterium]
MSDEKRIHPEYQYLKLLARILKDGKTKQTRGSCPIKSVFGAQLRFDMRFGFPLLTTKKTAYKSLTHEMLWFISGKCQTPEYLNANGVKIWDGFQDANAVKEGTLGRIYGVQWRHWRKPDGTEFDQLQWAIDEVKNNPNSKAIIVSGWNAGELDEMRLPPCHTMFQLDVIKGKLYMQLYQRSSDVFLGLPFNIAQYSELLLMIAKLTGLEAREFVISIGDAHLYSNQIDAAKEQLQRKPLPFPKLVLHGNQKTIDDFKFDDFELVGYESHPAIKVPIVIV